MPLSTPESSGSIQPIHFNPTDCTDTVIPDPQTRADQLPRTRFYGLHTPEGRVQAIASVQPYNDQYAFISLRELAVDSLPDLPHFLLALQTKAKVKILGANTTDRLLDAHRAAGFCYAFRQHHYTGACALDPIEAITTTKAYRIKPLSRWSFRHVLAYDTTTQVAVRKAYLKAWLFHPGTLVRVAYDGRRVVGYGVLTPGPSHHRLGPFTAEHPDVARALLIALCRETTTTPISLIIPTLNKAALALAETAKLEHVGDSIRLYTRLLRKEPLESVYAQTSYSLG